MTGKFLDFLFELRESLTVTGAQFGQASRIDAHADEFQVGEHFDWRSYRFEVMDLDGARVDKILILPRRETATADDDSG